MRMQKNFLILFVLISILLVSAVSNVSAALDVVNTWTGNIGYSSDGFGSTSQTGTISAQVPAGSTVLAAYLYTSINSGNEVGDGTTLNATVVNFTASVINTSESYLLMRRADVTAIVKPIIDAGPGGVYDFSVTETNVGQDGEALVVIFENASLPESTFGLLNGFTDVNGETTVVYFAEPLDPTTPAFFAEMFLGIGFSYPPQASTVAVNGTTITENAGGYDDGEPSNGALITVGGFNDPFSSLLPSYDEDHERYDISPYVQNGDTNITIFTQNPSSDDNIFIAGFYVLGAAYTEPPGPAAAIPTLSEWGMIIFSLLLGGVAIWYMRKNSHTGYTA